MLAALPVLLALVLAPVTEAASPAWRVLGVTAPTNLPPQEGAQPGSGTILVYMTNVGGAPTDGTPISLSTTLPEGISLAGTATGGGWSCGPVVSDIVCTSNSVVPSGGTATVVKIPVEVGALAAEHSVAPVTISGGGATEWKSSVEVAVSSQQASSGIQALWAGAFDENGVPATQAGGHPFSAGAAFLLNTIETSNGNVIPAGDIRDVEVQLPPGFVGNPTVTDKCPQEQLIQNSFGDGSALCPSSAVIGSAQPVLGRVDGESGFSTDPPEILPIYNGEPAYGFPAEFAFPYATAQAVVLGALRSDSDYGVTVTAPDLPAYFWTYGSFTMLHGNPADPGDKAFLTNPSSCAEQARVQPITAINTNTWQASSVFANAQVDIPPVVGCDQLGKEFNPQFSFQPTTTSAASVSGATADLRIDQSGLTDPNRLASPHLKDSVVTLPEGFALNPSAAEGLQTCSTEQIGLMGTGFPMPNPVRFDKASPRCPDASKIGTVEAQSPVLDETLHGTVYLAAQNANPFNSLLALYLVIDNPKLGVVVKLPGKVEPSSQTGQMTARFDNNPQLPISDLRLRFRGGDGQPRSTLATPDVCTTYTTRGAWTPWSAPESGPAAQTTDDFTLSGGPGGRPCPTSKAARPFSPDRTAGTTGTQAGGYSPFVLRVDRKDGEQELKRVEINLPPGLTGKLAGVATCSQAAIDSAKGKTGKAEQASSSCPQSSQIGVVRTTAGVGGSPIEVGGKAYLAGPYEKAPLSVVVVTPAVAGPFDLGNVVLRTPLFVDPKTAQLRAVSDEVPHILEGIPLLLRSVEIKMDRQDFTLNPTNCSKMQVGIALTGAGGDPQSNADDVISSQTVPFQVGGCRALAFKPNVQIQLNGGTKRAKYQRLTATVTYPKGSGYANIARAAVTLPHSAFLAQEHIRTVCTRVQFAAHACPPGSVYGHATAITPLLDEPLTGPVYLRSSNNPLPDLVAALRGPDSMPIEVELAGRTDSVHSSLRNTFDLVPDAPVSKFTLQLFGGKKSLVVNSRDLCIGKKQKATVRLAAQNGMARNFQTVVKNDCKRQLPKKTKKKAKAKSRRGQK